MSGIFCSVCHKHLHGDELTRHLPYIPKADIDRAAFDTAERTSKAHSEKRARAEGRRAQAYERYQRRSEADKADGSLQRIA